MSIDYAEGTTALHSLGADLQTMAVSRLLQTAQKLLDRDRPAAITMLTRATRLLEMQGEATITSRVSAGGLAAWQANRVVRYVEQHLAEQIQLRHLAAEARLSIGHFGRAFRNSFGRTAHGYVVERRLARARAKTMMLQSNAPLCEITLACGLSDQGHLSRLFRNRTGMTPRSWRRLYNIST